MTWLELAQSPTARHVWIFYGQCPGGRTVAWGTAAVATQTGPVEHRLHSVGDVTRGIPDAHDGPPERIDTTLVLTNHDRSLDWLLIGGPSVTTEFTGDSALNLSGRLVLAWIEGGEWQIKVVTPTLCVAGSPSQAGGLITLPLASRDELLVGRSDKVVRVRDLITATASTGKSSYSENGIERDFFTPDWRGLTDTFVENLDEEIPWVYGRHMVRLMPVTNSNTPGRQVMLGWLSWIEPSIVANGGWERYSGQYGEPPLDCLSLNWAHRQSRDTIKVPLFIPGMGSFWLVLFSIDRTFSQQKALLEDDHFILPAAADRIGMPAGVAASPPAIIRQVVTRHTPAGVGGIDSTSFARAEAAAASTNGFFGGAVKADASIAETLGQLAALGYGIWIDVDDKLHVQALGTLSPDEDRSSLPVIRPSDIAAGTWREWVPAQAAERGAPVTRTKIRWTSDQEERFPEAARRATAPGLPRVALAQEAEVEIAGDWIFPPTSDFALAGAGARRSYVTRRISVVCAAWTASLEIGQLARLTHPYGMDVTGSYRQRLVRVERITLHPAEMGVALQLEDLGPLEALRIGQLDTRANWVERIPSAVGSPDLVMSGGVRVKTTKSFFKPSDEGLSLQTWGAPSVGNRRSWRIQKVVSDTDADLTEVTKAETIPASPAGTALIDQNWILMHNRTSRGWGYRPWAITAADEDAGVFTDGSDGFVMLP